MLGALLLLSLLLVVVVVGFVTGGPRPTQYAWPSQKLLVQSFETAGFQAMNWS